MTVNNCYKNVQRVRVREKQMSLRITTSQKRPTLINSAYAQPVSLHKYYKIPPHKD